MKRLKQNQSGALGDLVASRNRFGEYDRKRVSPKHPGTASQLEAWGNMKYLSALWNGLREDQRVAWRRLALELHTRPNMLQSGKLDGPLLFKKINRVLATLSVYTIIEGECFRINEGVAGDPGWSWRGVTAERL